MSEMTLPSRHRILNSNPGGLRPSTQPLAHGGSPQYCVLRVDGEGIFLFLSSQLLLTTEDLVQNYEDKIQTDLIVLVFRKAFGVVPHQRFLHKLDHYGTRGPTLLWIQNFLTTRTQKVVVVDGSFSDTAHVGSGVPQGTVLGPILFLCYINDLPSSVSSDVRLFADDCLLYRPIKSKDDQKKLQEDLTKLERWADIWGMKFNPSKCSVLRVKRPRAKKNHLPLPY